MNITVTLVSCRPTPWSLLWQAPTCIFRVARWLFLLSAATQYIPSHCDPAGIRQPLDSDLGPGIRQPVASFAP